MQMPPAHRTSVAGFIIKAMAVSVVLILAALSVALLLMLRRGMRIVDAVATPASAAMLSTGTAVVSASIAVLAPAAAATKAGCHIANTAICSTHAALGAAETAAQTARLAAESSLFAARLGRETLTYLTSGGDPTSVPPTLRSVASKGAELLQDEHVAALKAAVERRAADAAAKVPAPWRVAWSVAAGALSRASTHEAGPSREMRPERPDEPIFRLVPRRPPPSPTTPQQGSSRERSGGDHVD